MQVYNMFRFSDYLSMALYYGNKDTSVIPNTVGNMFNGLLCSGEISQEISHLCIIVDSAKVYSEIFWQKRTCPPPKSIGIKY